MIKKTLFPLLGLLALSACATPEQLAEQQHLQRAYDEQTCANYGLRPGKEAFANCLMQLDLMRQQHYYYNDSHYYRSNFGTHFYYSR